MPGGPLFWGSILVRSVRIGGPFWGSILVPLGLHFPGPRFWTSVGFPVLVFGPPLASGARFWTSSCGFVLGPSRPTISESPYICFKSSSHPLFASLAFVFPFAPPKFLSWRSRFAFEFGSRFHHPKKGTSRIARIVFLKKNLQTARQFSLLP